MPYEQSCDRLPIAIASIMEYISNTETALEDLMANPPETLIYEKYNGAYNKPLPIEVERPLGFDPNKSGYNGRADNYASLFEHSKRDIESNIKSAKNQLAYFEKRLANWVAPSSS